MIHRFVDLLETPGVGFPCLGIHNHDGFNFSYISLIPYDGTGVAADGTTEKLSAENASFTFTPMMDSNSRRIIWKQADLVRIINEDGSDEAQIGQTTYRAYSPWWHPNGSKILYLLAIADAISSPDVIQTMDPDGTNQTTLYTAPDATNAFLRCPPSYNCDGTRIAFGQRVTSTTVGIKTMNADGSNVQQIATFPTVAGSSRFDSPVWSWYTADPDRLVIQNTNTVASPIVKAMDYDGTNQVTLDTGTTRSRPGHFAVMSGDTHYVTRTSTKIVLVALDGSGATDLLTPAKAPNKNVFSDATPCSGGRIYFDATNFPSGDDVRSCLPDGSGERNETSASARAYDLTG